MERTYDNYKADKLRSRVYDALLAIAQEEDASFEELEQAVEFAMFHMYDDNEE